MNSVLVIIFTTLLIIVTIGSFLVVLYLMNVFFTKVPFVPINKNTNKKVLEYIKTENLLKDRNIIYDLGSGDGRLLFLLAKEYKDKKFLGYEIGPFPFLFSKFKQFFWRVKNVDIKYGNFFKKDLKDADFIFCYLLPKVLDSLLEKFKQELKENTLIVTCDFGFSKLSPKQTIELKDKKYSINKSLFLYELNNKSF